jgi:hypothetical protein
VIQEEVWAGVGLGIEVGHVPALPRVPAELQCDWDSSDSLVSMVCAQRVVTNPQSEGIKAHSRSFDARFYGS